MEPLQLFGGCCRGLNSCQKLWPHVPNIAIVSCTSNMPQNNVGDYLGFSIRMISPGVPSFIGLGFGCAVLCCLVWGFGG